MGKYRYTVELIEDIPEYMGIDKIREVESQKEWFGHSFGDPVGRIYTDGRVESFFNSDIERGTTDWLDILRNSGKLRQRHRNLINRETWKEYECDEFYLMYRIVGHSSEMPTITDVGLDTCMNVRYEYTYEILMVVDDELRRYITDTIYTEGPGTYSLVDVISSFEGTFEEWADEGKEYICNHIKGEIQLFDDPMCGEHLYLGYVLASGDEYEFKTTVFNINDIERQIPYIKNKLWQLQEIGVISKDPHFKPEMKIIAFEECT